MTKSVCVLAPAKVNLYLKILGKRKDGYHSLESLFAKISVYDKLYVSKKDSAGVSLGCTDSSLPVNSDNIVYKAAELFLKTFKIRHGVHIRLVKNIPHQAGLGGGSSDAASTLMAMKTLFKVQCSGKKIQGLAAKLGSDCPFFTLKDGMAMVRGRGERLRGLKMSSRRPIWLCLVKPNFGISTAKAYRNLPTDFAISKAPSWAVFKRALSDVNPSSLGKVAFNSMEYARLPQIKKINQLKKSLLAAGAIGSLMSGSGSCVFGIYLSRHSALRSATIMKKKYPSPWVKVAHTL